MRSRMRYRRRGMGSSDRTAPTLQSAAINAAGTALTLTLSEAVTGAGSGADGFTLGVASLYAPATLTYSSGNGTASLVYTISRTVLAGETITRTYTPGVVTDLATNALASFSAQAVTNNSTVFNPASLSNCVGRWTAGPTWCFSDAGGTTPCASGDSVYVWKDRSGAALNFSQATAAQRPTLVDLGSGKWVVRGNGTSTNISCSAPAAAVRAWYAGVNRISTTGEAFSIATLLTRSGADADTVRTGTTTSMRAKFSTGSTTGGADAVDHSFTTGTTGWGFDVNGVADTAAYAIGTPHVLKSRAPSDSVPTYAAGVTLFKRGSAAERYYHGEIYELLGFSADVTGGNNSSLVTYLQGLY